MRLAAKVYEAFKDDEHKARVLAEVVEELESRIAPLRDAATRGDLEVTKLALQKEIEQVRREIEQVRLSLQREIEQVRGEVEQVRLSLQKEIEQVRGEIDRVRLSLQKEIEQVRREIEQVKASILKWVAGLLVVQTGVIVSVIALLR